MKPSLAVFSPCWLAGRPSGAGDDYQKSLFTQGYYSPPLTGKPALYRQLGQGDEDYCSRVLKTHQSLPVH